VSFNVEFSEAPTVFVSPREIDVEAKGILYCMANNITAEGFNAVIQNNGVPGTLNWIAIGGC